MASSYILSSVPVGKKEKSELIVFYLICLKFVIEGDSEMLIDDYRITF